MKSPTAESTFEKKQKIFISPTAWQYSNLINYFYCLAVFELNITSLCCHFHKSLLPRLDSKQGRSGQQNDYCPLNYLTHEILKNVVY